MKLTLVMVPTALVLPSLKTSLWSMCRYSGVLMKRKCTVALSPVRKQSLVIDRIVAVCLMLPQCTVGRERQVWEKPWGENLTYFKSHIHTAFKSVRVQVSHPWLDILARWSSGDAKLVSRPQTPSMPVGLILVTPWPFPSLLRSAWSERERNEIEIRREKCKEQQDIWGSWTNDFNSSVKKDSQNGFQTP